MKIELDDDAPPLIVRALEHYGSYLKATNRDDSRYQAIADLFKERKPIASEVAEPVRKKKGSLK